MRESVYRHFFYFSLIPLISLSAYEGIGEREGSKVGLAYHEWRCIKECAARDEDFVLLHDGTVLLGRLGSLPPLDYSFGSVKLSVDDVSVAIFFMEGGHLKAQYITRQGENYIAAVKAKTLTFLVPDRRSNNELPQDIRMADIDAILISSANRQLSTENDKLFSLEFKNGDQLPVAPALESITLSDGKNDFLLNVGDVLDLSYNGGLQGVLKDKGEEVKGLRYSLVRDKYFCFQLVHDNSTLKLPWDKIASIQGYNGGFKKTPSSLDAKEIGFTFDKEETAIAFASDAFDAFMQPIYSEKEKHEGNADLKEGDEPLKKGTDDAKRLFANVDFSSPFNIGFLLESHGASSVEGDEGGDIFLAGSFADHEEDAGEVAMLAGSVLTEINDDLLFANLQTTVIDPETFDVVDNEYDDWQPSVRLKDYVFVPQASKVVETEDEIRRLFALAGDHIHVAVLPTYPAPTFYTVFDAFYIEALPVTNGEYKKFAGDRSEVFPSTWVDGHIPQGEEDKSVAHVGYEQAQSYAQWAEKRLPTQVEWSRAISQEGFVEIEGFNEWVVDPAFATVAAGSTRCDPLYPLKGVCSSKSGRSDTQKTTNGNPTTFRCIYYP